jgi:hypothetical protein
MQNLAHYVVNRRSYAHQIYWQQCCPAPLPGAIRTLALTALSGEFF